MAWSCAGRATTFGPASDNPTGSAASAKPPVTVAGVVTARGRRHAPELYRHFLLTPCRWPPWAGSAVIACALNGISDRALSVKRPPPQGETITGRRPGLWGEGILPADARQ
jgi:hypothetical protein